MDFSAFTVKTERLTLRVVQMSDAAALAGLMSPGISARVASWPYPLSIDKAGELISIATAGVATGQTMPMVITTGHDGRTVGWLRLSRSETDRQVMELGYWIGEEFQGRGYAMEAARAAVQAAFERLGVEAVEAGAQPVNAISHHLLKKLGMREIGERSVYAPARQRYGICLFWRIDRAEHAG